MIIPNIKDSAVHVVRNSGIISQYVLRVYPNFSFLGKGMSYCVGGIISAYRTLLTFGVTFLARSSSARDLYVLRKNFKSILMQIEALTSITYFSKYIQNINVVDDNVKTFYNQIVIENMIREKLVASKAIRRLFFKGFTCLACLPLCPS